MTHPLTYDLAEAAARIGGVTEKWLAARLRAGKLPGRKVGRQWRMTESDIEAAVELFGVGPQMNWVGHEPHLRTEGASSGLTRTRACLTNGGARS